MRTTRMMFLSLFVITLLMLISACTGTTGTPTGGVTTAGEAAETPAEGAGATEEGGEEGVATPVAQEGQAATVVEAGELTPPVVATPCTEGSCPFEGQTVTVIVNTAGEKGPISGPFYEVREEFEAATGATLEIVEVPFAEHFPKLMTDLTTGTGQYDTSIAGAWWLGDLVGGDFILP